jgi:Domain of unknown function (DUF5060)
MRQAARLFIVVLFLMTLVGVASEAAAAPPQVTNLTGGSSPVGLFQKIEWTFDLSKTYANPYYFFDATDTPAANPATMTWFGVDGVSIDLHVTAPSGRTLVVPGFYFDNYLRVKDTSLGLEVLGRAGQGHWAVRFTPSETGTYQYYLTAQDKDGTGRFPASGTQSFSVNPSANKGFVRASPADTRFLAYDNGSSFVPVGSGHQWWTNNALRSYDYENAFANFGANGVNLTRMWDQVDFGLSVEGVSQPVWVSEGTVYGAAKGVEVNTANVHAGLRSAKPSAGQGWIQRLAVSEPTRLHKLTVYIRTDSVAGGQSQVNIRTGTSFNAGTLLAQIAGVSGTTPWTAYSITLTPNVSVLSINLLQGGSTGTMYVDDVAFGPVDGSGNIIYNIVSDGDFERHFFKDNPGNDPNGTPGLPRPIGTFMNPWAAYEMDKIVESAEANGVRIQDCSCSGPWFTWPLNIAQSTDADWAAAWVLKSWERNFRYRVARWGYSPAILAWELFNEMGHIPPGSNIYNFLQTYGAYQRATDPYAHIRTNSQNSQAYSPGMWSSSAMDMSNTHWYLDGHIASLDPDESLTVNRFAWCLTDNVRGTSSPYCSGLGLGDGSTWTGPPKPWVWGEVGVGLDGTQGNTGEAGSRFLHNIVWSGLFTPLGTTPLEWWWYQEDSVATAAKFAARKAASAFFNSVDYAHGNFTYLMTAGDGPPGYSGENVVASDPKVRVYAMRRADKAAAYLWVQHRDYLWSKASTTPSAVSSVITVSNLLNAAYRVEIWNTATGGLISQQIQTPSGGSLSVQVSGLTKDVAIKIDSTTSGGTPPAPPTNLRIVP